LTAFSEFRPVMLVTGLLVATLGVAMLLPALVDLAADNKDWMIFASSGTMTMLVGLGLFAANRGIPKGLSTRQAMLMTVVSWVALVAFGALPFHWSGVVPSYTDAFFESMSGLTTTGATVITGLDSAPPGILFWRGLLQWLGGLGIIVMAIAVLPMLQIGGMQLFKAEAFDTAEKILPRATQISTSITLVFIAMTGLCAVAYMAVGMAADDAVIHAMTTVATGGFSTKDASIGYFNNPAVEWIAVVFMVLGSIPFILYVQMLQGRFRPFLADDQVKAFAGFLAVAILAGWMMAHFSENHIGSGGLAPFGLQRGLHHHRHRIRFNRLRPLGPARGDVLLHHHVCRRLRRLHLLRHQDLPVSGADRSCPAARLPGDVSAWRVSRTLQRKADPGPGHRLGDELLLPVHDFFRGAGHPAAVERARHRYRPFGCRHGAFECRAGPGRDHRPIRKLPVAERPPEMAACGRDAAWTA
jgi:hypothetical protein